MKNINTISYNLIQDRFHQTLCHNFLEFIDECSLSGTSGTVSLYEQKLSKYFSSKFAVALSSGGASILVALKSVGVESGDEVILAPTCPLCTVYPILAIGAVPVFCDTLNNNFALNSIDFKNVITKRTKCIIDVPMWGYPTAIDNLRKLADEYNIKLISDLAHAHGTTINNKHISSFADIACYSTHVRKVLSTGEGGFILTNNETYYKNAVSYSRYGHLDGERFGLNFLLSSLQAALGIQNLIDLESNLRTRRNNAFFIRRNIINKEINELPILNNGSPNYYTLLLQVAENKSLSFINHLMMNGIPSDIIKYKCKPVYDYKILHKFRRNCINAKRLLKSLTTIPVHPGVSAKQLNIIIEAINSWDT